MTRLVVANVQGDYFVQPTEGFDAIERTADGEYTLTLTDELPDETIWDAWSPYNDVALSFVRTSSTTIDIKTLRQGSPVNVGGFSVSGSEP